jgi:WD40 repeat protein
MHSHPSSRFHEADSGRQAANRRTSLPVSPRWQFRAVLGHALLPCVLLGLGILIDYATPGSDQQGAGCQTFTGHDNQVSSVAFAPDGLTLASTSLDRTLRLWSVGTRKTKAILPNDVALTAVAYQPGGRILATLSEEGTTSLWDVSSGDRFLMLRGEALTRAVAFSPDGQALASCDAGGEIRLWEPRTGKLLSVLHGEHLALNTLAWSPDGKAIAAAGLGNRVLYWNLKTQTRTSFQTSDKRAYILSISFSPDGKLLAVAGPYDTNVAIWDVESRLESTRLISHTNWASCVAFSGDGRFVASASAGGKVLLWEVASGKVAGILHGHQGQINAVAFSPDSSLLASAGSDATIRLWDVRERPR